MAKSGTGKANDFLEILMLTGFFCALFFACWGAYLHFSKASNLEERDRQHRNTLSVHAFLTDPNSVRAMQDYKRKESSNRSGTVRADLDEVLDGLGSGAPKVKKLNPGSGANRNKIPGLEKLEYKALFHEGGTLRSYVMFYGRLKQLKPHIDVTRLRMTRKKSRSDKTADTWDVNVDLLTFRKKSEG